MIIPIPNWAKDVEDEGTIVLLWLLRHLASTYPLTKKEIRLGQVNAFNLVQTDVETILGMQERVIVDYLYDIPCIKENLSVANIGSGFVFQFKRYNKVVNKEINSRKYIEIMLYLLGATNNNLIDKGFIRSEYMQTQRNITHRWPFGPNQRSAKSNEEESVC